MNETKIINHPMNRQIGIFEISETQIRTEPEKIQLVMAEVVVLEAKYRWDHRLGTLPSGPMPGG